MEGRVHCIMGNSILNGMRFHAVHFGKSSTVDHPVILFSQIIHILQKKYAIVNTASSNYSDLSGNINLLLSLVSFCSL